LVFTGKKKDLLHGGLTGTFRLYLKQSYKSIDLTIFLQQKQLLLCSNFPELKEIGRMTLICNPLLFSHLSDSAINRNS